MKICKNYIYVQIKLAAMVGLVVVVVSCLGDSFPPSTPNPRPPSCGNDVCDLGFEDCDNCPEDCPCCSAISSAASEQVTSPELALGKGDGQAAILGETSSMILVLGREVYNRQPPADVDFVLEGEVTSASTAQALNATCPTDSDGTGAFEVLASVDGSRFFHIGLWTQEINEFDIGCAELNSARFIQIRGQPGSSATLDAISSEACATTNIPVTP